MIFALAPFALFSFCNHRGHNGTLGVGQGLVVRSPGDPCCAGYFGYPFETTTIFARFRQYGFK
jgi:hypothetical protein